MTTVTPYPLCWPDGVARTPPVGRGRSPFRTTYAGAVDNIVRSLRGFQKDSGIRVDHPILSSDVDLMGRLRANDPGVAAWFQFDGQMVAFAVDRFADPAANAQAIHHIVEARRVELRYGGLNIVRQTFRSFHALLPAPGAKRPWREVLGLVVGDVNLALAETVYRERSKRAHPDLGGSDAAMAALNVAIDDARRELGT